MKEAQTRVRDCMMKFGQETHNCNPTIPSLEIRKLRAKLILEEALETIAGLGISLTIITEDWEDVPNISIDDFIIKQAKGKENLVSIADGIADSLVVQLGTAVACGIDIEPIFEEVMRSNDSKLWFEEEVALETTYEGDDSSFSENDKHYEFVGEDWNMENRQWLVKDKDGKVIKSPSYSPANIASLLNLCKS